jgi:hypothetical protein
MNSTTCALLQRSLQLREKTSSRKSATIKCDLSRIERELKEIEPKRKLPTCSRSREKEIEREREREREL